MLTIDFALPPLLVNPRSSEGQKAREVIKRCAQSVGKAKMNPQGVTFEIFGRAFHPRMSKVANAKALGALLGCLVELDAICWERNPYLPGLYESGVFYELMPTQSAWETTPTLYARGKGDCKSLAASRIAELARQGLTCKPVFRFNTNSWGTMFHILILRSDGVWECPSRQLGMTLQQEMPR